MVDKLVKTVDVYESRAFFIKYRDDGVVVYEQKNVDELLVEDIIEGDEYCNKISQGQPLLRLVIIDKFISTDPEVRAYAASKNRDKFVLADALVIQSQAMKIIANFYLRFNKPSRPTKIFTDREEGLNWLLSFK